jgi:hypothetical protein
MHRTVAVFQNALSVFAGLNMLYANFTVVLEIQLNQNNRFINHTFYNTIENLQTFK